MSLGEALICPQTNTPCALWYCRATAELLEEPSGEYQQEVENAYGEQIGAMVLASTPCTVMRAERLAQLSEGPDISTRELALQTRALLLVAAKVAGAVDPLQLYDEKQQPGIEQIGLTFHELIEDFAGSDRHRAILDSVVYIDEELGGSLERLHQPEQTDVPLSTRLAAVGLCLALAIQNLSMGEYGHRPRYLPSGWHNPERRMADRPAGEIAMFEPVNRQNYLERLRHLAMLTVESPAHFAAFRALAMQAQTLRRLPA